MRQRANQKRDALYAGLEPFFQEIEKKYGVTREEILRVAEELGAVKGKINTYFLVNNYIRKKEETFRY